MDSLRIWQRMLWKELRESGPILLVGVLLPLCVLFFHGKPREELIYPCAGLVSLLISLWAASRIQENDSGKKRPRVMLPVTGITRWAFTFLIPAIVPLLTGLASGLILSKSNTAQLFHGVIFATALYMLANFALCTVLATVFSVIPAIMVGVGFLFATLDPTKVGSESQLFLFVIGGSLLGALFWEGFKRRRQYRGGRIWATASVLGVVLLTSFAALYVLDVTSNYMIAQNNVSSYRQHEDHYTPDGRVILYYFDGAERKQKETSLKGTVLQMGSLKDTMLQTGSFDRSHQLLAQQDPGNSTIHLIRWDSETNTTCELAQIAAFPDTLQCCMTDSISPDHRYVALVTRSRVGTGCDLWMVDLTQHRSLLSLPDVQLTSNNGYFEEQESWAIDRLFLTSLDESVAVDLPSLRASHLDIPYPRRLAL